MQNYELRIYRPVSRFAGELDHVERFDTFDNMATRYKELYKKENGLLNPTAWEYKELIEYGFNWGFNWYKISDVTMYNAINKI